MMTPSASAPAVIESGDNVFQICFTDPNQGVASADYIADNKLGTKVGVIYDSSDAYSSGIYEKFKAEAAAKNLEIVTAEAFTADNKPDLSTQVAKCQEAGADLVFLPIYYQEASQILIAANKSGYEPVFFGCDGMDGILSIDGFDTSLAEGLMLLTPFAADAQDEKTQAFIKMRKGYEEGRDILLENARKLQERLEGLKEKRHQVEMDSVRKTSEMESTAGILADNFKLSVEEAREKALTDIGEGALKKEEILLAQKIEDLGPVNLAAEEDYQAAKERYEFLTKQYDDMVTAKKQLELVISGINSDMTKRFREAFDKINEYFGKCYEKLFGGGKARLVIQNEENLLETGIDIEAQPPGKKMRNLSLFSGGERALTVIALLFALLSYHPAPFVILDEIDAPLDETNIDRFAEFLRDYGKRTQFIIITHRKGTMEAADTLHGVTMSESGVSRVLSVKLSEVAAS